MVESTLVTAHSDERQGRLSEYFFTSVDKLACTGISTRDREDAYLENAASLSDTDQLLQFLHS